MYLSWKFHTLLIIIPISFLAKQIQAQESNATAGKRFGIIAGANISNMNFNKGFPAPATPIKASWKAGMTIGFVVNVQLTNSLFLQPGYYYTLRNGADNSINVNYSLQYLSLPLLLKYMMSSRISFLAGPQAELLVHANADSNGVKHTITHDVEERSIGVAIGVDVKLTRSFFISARYFHGLNHIGIGQRSDVKEFKYAVANLSLGIML